MKQLEHEFVSLVTLGNIINCVYIIKIEAILGPLLLVFRNDGSDSKNMNKLFCTLPQATWRKYFCDVNFHKIRLVDSTYIFLLELRDSSRK
jgi:hypothetical protein